MTRSAEFLGTIPHSHPHPHPRKILLLRVRCYASLARYVSGVINIRRPFLTSSDHYFHISFRLYTRSGSSHLSFLSFFQKRKKRTDFEMESLRLVRITSPDQLAPLAEQATRSWIGSPIFDMLCPEHRASPPLFRKAWRLILRNELATPGAVVLAAFRPGSSSDDTRNAVGFASWHRHGPSAASQGWHSRNTLRQSKEHNLFSLFLPLKKRKTKETILRHVTHT